MDARMDANHRPPPSQQQPPTPAAAAGPGVFAGVDVSKATLEPGHSGTQEVVTLPNDAAGHAAAAAVLTPLSPAVAVVESTGGRERPLVAALLEAGVPVAVVHPGRVRAFARGPGILAKTDRIDAGVLVRFGRQAGPRLAERRSRNAVELQALVVCRRQLSATRARQANRLGATDVKAARRAVGKVIAAVDKQSPGGSAPPARRRRS